MSNKSNLVSFNRDLKKFKDLTNEQADIVARKVAFDIHAKLIETTPVDTGRAKGNWFPSVGSPSTEVNEGTTVPDFNSAIPQNLPPFSKLWVTNNLPYIQALNDGHSDQAPLNFVDIAVFEIVENL